MGTDWDDANGRDRCGIDIDWGDRRRTAFQFKPETDQLLGAGSDVRQSGERCDTIRSAAEAGEKSARS